MTDRVIIYRLGSLGDTIVALPCFHKVAESFPDATRTVLTNVPESSKAAPLESILGGSGLIHGALAYPVATRSPAALWHLRRRLLSFGARTLIYLTPRTKRAPVLRDILYFRLCGFTTIIGAPLEDDLLRPRIDPVSGELEPECGVLARRLARLGPVDLDDPRSWTLDLTTSERATGHSARDSLAARPFIAINMGGKAAPKDWGEDNWRLLLGRLGATLPGFGLLVVGGAEDARRADEVTAAWPGPVASACGTLSPRECAGAIEGASLFVGHDSGPLHLASVSGVPYLGLFGDFNRPKRWHPYPGVGRIIHDMRGVRAISVDEVVAAALALLAGVSEPAGATR